MSRIGSRDKNAAYGNKWTDKEEKKLLKELRKGKSVEDIASEHERSIGGITARINKIVLRFHNEGKNVIDIMNLTGFSESRVEEITNKRSYSKTKEKKDVDRDILDRIELLEETFEKRLKKIDKKLEKLLSLFKEK